MPLHQTNALIERYATKLIDGTFTTQELQKLLSSSTFGKSAGYADPNKPVSDSNFNQWNGIIDFVATIGPNIPADTLHQITEQLIRLAPDRGENTFMRNSTLEKAFLAYEMAYYPNNAQSHFYSDRMVRSFPNENDIANLKRVILQPGVALFESSIDAKLEALIKQCQDYKTHLEHALKNPRNKQLEPINNKLHIVNQLIGALENTNVNKITRIHDMKEVLTVENRATLNKHRDSSRFLETVLNILSIGLYSKFSKGTFAFWKSHGEAMVDKLDEQNTKGPGK